MATLRGAWAGVWAMVLVTGAWAQDEPLSVGDRGELDRLVIHGASAVADDELRSALAVDIDVAVAARRDAPLQTFCRALAERTKAGYLYAGFAEARVDVTFQRAADAVVVQIAEGTRYAAGELVIEGVEPSIAARLREALTVCKAEADENAGQSQQSVAPKSRRKAAWSLGEPACLGFAAERRLREIIESQLYDCGYLFPQFELEAVPDPAQCSVALRISFSDPGRPASLDEIAVLGEQEALEDDILQFLAIEKGMPWTGEMRERLEKRLQQSGRFLKAKLGETKPSAPDGKLVLWIEVKRYAKAPPLSQPLSREEESLLRLGQWLGDFSEGNDDLSIRYEADDYAIEAVISPQSGILAIVRKRPHAASNQPAPISWAFVTSDERIGLYSVPRSRKLVAVPTPAPVVANASLALHNGPPEFDGRGQIMFGLGMASSRNRRRRRHCEFCFKDSAVSLLSLAHEYDSRLRWEGDALIVEYNDRRLKFNGMTGKLLEFGWDEEGDVCRLTVLRGEFARKLAELDDATRQLPNDADANAARPLSSVLEFLADETLACQDSQTLKSIRPRVRLLRKLISLGMLRPFDRLGVAACQPTAENDSFWIPRQPLRVSLDHVDFSSSDWFRHPQVQQTLQSLADCFGIRLERALLPEAGWLQAVYREAIYAQANKAAPDERAVDLTKLCASSSAGPLCCLSAAAAAQTLPMGVPASLLANLGKTRLSLADFQRDYRALLDADSFVGECLLCLAEALRGLGPQEVETLVEMLKSVE